MYRINRIVIIICSLVFSLLCTGCSKNTLYPEADVLVVSATPYNIIPTGVTLDSTEEGVITVRLLNEIQCNLVSYDINYKSCLGQDIESLALKDINIQIPIVEKGTDYEITIRPYTMQLMNLLNNTASEISPVQANVTLHFHDINGRDTTRTASFLLYKYVASN